MMKWIVKILEFLVAVGVIYYTCTYIQHVWETFEI